LIRRCGPPKVIGGYPPYARPPRPPPPSSGRIRTTATGTMWHGCGSRRVSAWGAGWVVPVLPVVRMVRAGTAWAAPVTTSLWQRGGCDHVAATSTWLGAKAAAGRAGAGETGAPGEVSGGGSPAGRQGLAAGRCPARHVRGGRRAGRGQRDVILRASCGLLQNRGVSGCGVCPGLTGSSYGEGLPSG